MDNCVHYDFQGYSIPELIKGRNALITLDYLDFITGDMVSLQTAIADELERREKTTAK